MCVTEGIRSFLTPEAFFKKSSNKSWTTKNQLWPWRRSDCYLDCTVSVGVSFILSSDSNTSLLTRSL
ncbi:unnamed protein product [Schistosoma rodhaini]|nr:unnamed protein product [Schistosoma rodhaini]